MRGEEKDILKSSSALLPSGVFLTLCHTSNCGWNKSKNEKLGEKNEKRARTGLHSFTTKLSASFMYFSKRVHKTGMSLLF
jgi:hypothetical protein